MTILKTIQFAGIILLLQAAIPLAALGQHPTGAGTPSAQDPPPETAAAAPTAPAPINHPASVPKTSLADLAWLAGRWQGSWGPRVAQQVWTAPKAGVMMGTFQLAEDDKTLVLELFSMVEEPEGITLHLRHFTSSLVAWEKPAQPF